MGKHWASDPHRQRFVCVLGYIVSKMDPQMKKVPNHSINFGITFPNLTTKAGKNLESDKKHQQRKTKIDHHVDTFGGHTQR